MAKLMSELSEMGHSNCREQKRLSENSSIAQSELGGLTRFAEYSVHFASHLQHELTR